MSEKDIDFSTVYKFYRNHSIKFIFIFILSFSILLFSKNFIVESQKPELRKMLNFSIFPISSIQEAHFNTYNTIIYEVSRINIDNTQIFEKIIFDFQSNEILDGTTNKILESGQFKFFSFITRQSLLESFYEYLIKPSKLGMENDFIFFLQQWEVNFEKTKTGWGKLNISIPIYNEKTVDNNQILEILNIIEKQVYEDLINRVLSFLNMNKKRLERSEIIAKYYFEQIDKDEIRDSNMFQKISSFNAINKQLLELFIDEVKAASSLSKDNFNNVIIVGDNFIQKEYENRLENFYLFFSFIISFIVSTILLIFFIPLRSYIFK